MYNQLNLHVRNKGKCEILQKNSESNNMDGGIISQRFVLVGEDDGSGFGYLVTKLKYMPMELRTRVQAGNNRCGTQQTCGRLKLWA